MSAPAAKARSEPVMTIAPTPRSASSSAAAETTSRMRASFNALRAFGRFSVIVAVRPSRVTMMSS
jgi:hypothetical protein